MKLAILILISLLFSGMEFVLFVVLPEKIHNIGLTIVLFVSFLLLLFAGVYAIYSLGKFWNMEYQVKNILGICLSIIILSSILYSNIKNK